MPMVREEALSIQIGSQVYYSDFKNRNKAAINHYEAFRTLNGKFEAGVMFTP